jgi:hypothetical protein
MVICERLLLFFNFSLTSFPCLSLPRQETDVRAGKTTPGLNFEIMSQYESSHVPWTLPSSTFPALHFIVFVAHNNNRNVETHQVSKKALR